MILDRTWDKKNQKFIISYVNKDGRREFYQKYLHHIATYEYDPNGKLTNWDGRPCTKVFKDASKYQPNEFDQLEMIYELPEDIKKEVTAMRFPKLYFADIETEIDEENNFPEPEKAEQRIQLISLVGPDLSVMVLGIKPLDKEAIERIKEKYYKYLDDNDFARNLVKSKSFTPKVLYQYFPDEKAMLKHWFTKIMPHIGCLAGWNFYRFDWHYFWNRLVNVFGKLEAMQLMRAASPVHETTKISWCEMDGTRYSVPAPLHCQIFDYMELIKTYEYSMRPYESYSLDWVGEHGVGANKIHYDCTMKELYEKDFEMFVYYNAIDSCLNALIHYRFKSLESPCAMANVTCIPVQRAMGQVAVTTANLFKRFYQNGMHVVYDYDAVDRTKVEYEGAFCGCVSGRWEYTVCDDFASLYPSVIRTCNLSVENIVSNTVGPDSFGRYTKIPWTEADLDKFRKDPNYFVSVRGTVYKNDKEYMFPRMQREQMNLRNEYKYLNWAIQSELQPEIDKLIKLKEQEVA